MNCEHEEKKITINSMHKLLNRLIGKGDNSDDFDLEFFCPSCGATVTYFAPLSGRFVRNMLNEIQQKRMVQ